MRAPPGALARLSCVLGPVAVVRRRVGWCAVVWDAAFEPADPTQAEQITAMMRANFANALASERVGVLAAVLAAPQRQGRHALTVAAWAVNVDRDVATSWRCVQL